MRRLVLIGGRLGHVDADADSAVSDGGRVSMAGVSSASEAEEIEVPVAVGVPPVRPSVAAQRAGFGQFDHWDISEVFSCRVSVMRTVLLVFVEILSRRFDNGTRRDSCWAQQQEHAVPGTGMEIVLALLRMLLHRSPNQQGQVDWQI